MSKAILFGSLAPALVLTLAVTACAIAPPHGADRELVSSDDPQTIKRGRFLAHGPAHCASCHAGDITPQSIDANLSGGRRFELPVLGTFTAKNLTSDATTGLGAWTDAEVFRVLRTGRTREGRPLAPLMDTTGMTDADLLAIISYLRTLPAVEGTKQPPQVGVVGQVALRWLVGTPAHEPLAASSAEALQGPQLGAYLADRVANCKGCHTPRSALTGRLKNTPYVGGLELKETNGTFVVPAITRSGALQARSEREFIALFRQRAKNPGASPMPWAAYDRMSDRELSAIYQYLTTLPANGQQDGV